MMLQRLSRFLVCGAVAGTLLACQDEGGTPTPQVPLAGLRYLNIVSDTGALNFRIVDIFGDTPGAFGATFRTGGSPIGGAPEASPPYQAVEAGTRTIRVFNSSTDPAIAQQVLFEATFTFEANRNYTFFLYGFARAGQSPSVTALVTADDPPTPGAGQIAIRSIHLAPPGSGLGNVDVWVAPQPTGSALSGSPTVANQAFLNVSAYTSTATGLLRVAGTAPGTTSPILAGLDVNAPAGTGGANPIGGTNVAGSVLTAVIVPRSVAGSTAPQTAAFQNPSVMFLVDRRP